MDGTAGTRGRTRASPAPGCGRAVSTGPRRRHTRGLIELSRRIVVAVICGAGLALPANASAASGGAYPTSPATIKSVSCVAGCAAASVAQPGSLLRVRGSDMRNVERIVFLGGGGHADNVTVRTLKARRNSVDVAVPAKAPSGRLRAVNADGARSEASRAIVRVTRRARSSAALNVGVIGRRVFYDAERPARLDLLTREPMNVLVELVRVIDGASITSWPVPLTPEVAQQRDLGRHASRASRSRPASTSFASTRATAAPAAGVVAAQAPAAIATGTFELVDHKFPVRGSHTFGTGEAAFGAQRDGHTHEGHDVFARVRDAARRCARRRREAQPLRGARPATTS